MIVAGLTFRPIFTVALKSDEPGWPGMIQIYECQHCFAVVNEIHKHQAWHETRMATTEVL